MTYRKYVIELFNLGGPVASLRVKSTPTLTAETFSFWQLDNSSGAFNVLAGSRPETPRARPGRKVCSRRRRHYDDWLRGAVLESVSAGCRRTFLRLSFCANLLLRRFFSPGFRKKECFFTSLIIPSCWTCRLKRRRALSMDSPSKSRTSAKMCLPEICDRA